MITEKARRQERIGPAATVPTVPTVADHLTPGWLTSDIYKGELYFSLFSGHYRLWSRDDAGVFEIPLTPSGITADAGWSELTNGTGVKGGLNLNGDYTIADLANVVKALVKAGLDNGTLTT